MAQQFRYTSTCPLLSRCIICTSTVDDGDGFAKPVGVLWGGCTCPCNHTAGGSNESQAKADQNLREQHQPKKDGTLRRGPGPLQL